MLFRELLHIVLAERIYPSLYKHASTGEWDFVSACSEISNKNFHVMSFHAHGQLHELLQRRGCWLCLCCLCIPPPAPLASRKPRITHGFTQLPVSNPTSKLASGFRGRCLCCKLPSSPIFPQAASGMCSPHEKAHSSASPAFFRSLMCNLECKIQAKYRTKAAHVLKSFSPCYSAFRWSGKRYYMEKMSFKTYHKVSTKWQSDITRAPHCLWAIPEIQLQPDGKNE